MSADQLRQLLERIEQHERDKSFEPVLKRADEKARDRRFFAEPVSPTGFGSFQ